MKIELAATLGTLLLAWAKAKAIYNNLAKIAEPIVKEVEKRAQDGKIDKEDRKAIVMAGIAEAEQAGKIKLNFLTRWLIAWVVDKIAGKLPDFNISLGTIAIVDKAQANVVSK